MPISMLCSQCGSPAERCELCAGALCQRLLCSELHDAACSAVSALPSVPVVASAPAKTKTKPARDTDRDEEAERLQAEQLVLRISQHRQTGRSALLIGDLDTAFDALCAA